MARSGQPVALEAWRNKGETRAFSPSAARNVDVISRVLSRYLKTGMRVLELASGTGEHGVALTRRIDGLIWQPSDFDDAALRSIGAWARYVGSAELLPPLRIDAGRDDWPPPEMAGFQAIVCINMFHIAPWEAGEGVLRGAGRALQSRGVLYLYGPFTRGGQHTAPSNEAFDEHLRSRDPTWGVRDVDDIASHAQPHGLRLTEVVEMPSNNLSVVFEKVRSP